MISKYGNHAMPNFGLGDYYSKFPGLNFGYGNPSLPSIQEGSIGSSTDRPPVEDKSLQKKLKEAQDLITKLPANPNNEVGGAPPVHADDSPTWPVLGAVLAGLAAVYILRR